MSIARMNLQTIFLSLVVSAALGFAVEVPLLPGALPARSSSKFLPFREISGRIINGSPASRGQFPWQAALYLTKSDGTSFCGGALISPNWILSAAHCFPGVSAVTAYLGVVDLEDNSRTIAIGNRIVFHPSYDSKSLANDIALLQLSVSVVTNSYVTTIPLSSSHLGSDVSVIVSGWGTTNDESSDISQNLNYVTLTTISNSDCSSTYPNIGTGVVCAQGTTIESICSGDGGGPLVTVSDGNTVHVGVASFGSNFGCAHGYPVGFTRTASYRSWISSNAGI